MSSPDPEKYHKLYGVQKKRGSYSKKDFLDYALMLTMTGGLLAFAYGPSHAITMVGIAMCAFLLVAFPLRNGIALTVPLILRSPQEVLYSFIYKIANIRPIYFIAVAVLAAENLFIYLTPSLPHHTELMRTIALWLFFLHLAALTIYRTISLVTHLQKPWLVREFLMETPWNKKVKGKSILLEIFHAYFTGLLTHIVLIAPWFIVISHVNYSVLAIPVALAANVFTQGRWMKVYNDWLYRDHWLGHNSEFEFVYLHGTHHDAIPSGMIAVAGNGLLEGCIRHTFGSPLPFYNPFFAAFMYSMEVKGDMELHQFIPGMFPKTDLEFLRVHQHSMHHFGRLAPYGFGLKFDQPGISEEVRNKYKMLPEETRNTVTLDEQLNGFKWDNRPYRRMLAVYDKYREPEE